MRRFALHELVFCFAAFALSYAPFTATAIQVWQSTFDSGPDGVVDIADNNFAKNMIGSVTDGRLQITTMDNQTDAYTPDKAGRVLELNGTAPVPRTYNTSQSAQYKFRWTSVPTATAAREAYHFAGFLGPTGPQTRQVMGTLMTHWNVGNDYYMRIGLAAMGVGFTDFGYNAGPVINLGPNPINTDYELRIEFDGTSHVMSVKMFNGSSTLIAANTRDLDIDDPPPADANGVWHGWFAYGQTNFQNETNSISVTHLGWEDYTGWLEGDKAWTWEVDSLAYWDEPTVPLPLTQPSADYNHNGSVDAGDYIVWRKNLNAIGVPGTVTGDGTSSDLNGVPNGVVDHFDYDFWRSRYGGASGSGSSSALGGSPVPEPGSMLLIASAMSILLAAKRRQGRS
jgi:hypothetical protein